MACFGSETADVHVLFRSSTQGIFFQHNAGASVTPKNQDLFHVSLCLSVFGACLLSEPILSIYPSIQLDPSISISVHLSMYPSNLSIYLSVRISILPPFFVVDLDAETGTDFINATGWFMLTCIHRYHRCLDSRWICLGLAVATWMADPCWPLPSGSPDWQVVVRHIMCVYILITCVMSYLMKPMKEYLCRNSRLLMSFFLKYEDSLYYFMVADWCDRISTHVFLFP